MQSALWWVNNADALYPTCVVVPDDYSNTMKIPFVDLAEQQRRIRMDLDRRIARVLDHGAYVLGPEVSELEAALAARAGCSHCIA